MTCKCGRMMKVYGYVKNPKYTEYNWVCPKCGRTKTTQKKDHSEFMQQISFSGAHGTGKSTSAAFEYRNQKCLHPDKSVYLICDLESLCPFPINKETSEQAQSWIFANQIKHEINAASRFDILVTDRTIVDTVAYTYVAGFEGLACGMLSYAEQYVQVYDDIRVKQIENSPYCHPDGIRDTDHGFRAEVETILKNLYHQLQDAGVINGSLYFV